jgi:hypothetical protein
MFRSDESVGRALCAAASALAATGAIAVLLLAAGGPTSAHARSVAVATAASEPTLLTGWYAHYEVRPTSIYYTGDGSGLIGVLRPHGGLQGPGRGSLHWTRWTERGASAVGSLWLKLGTPAFSPYTRFALTLTAGRVRHGHYTRMTLHYTLHHTPRSDTWCVPDSGRVFEWSIPSGGRCG